MSGEELRPYITSNCNSLAEVARKLEISPQNLDGILKTKDIKTGFIQRLARAFGVPVSYFFDEPAQSYKVQHVGPGALLKEAVAWGNVNASTIADSDRVKELEAEVRIHDAHIAYLKEIIAEKDARIADLKERIKDLKIR